MDKEWNVPERKERKLTAELEPLTVKFLYNQVDTSVERTREERHCLDKAHAELGRILGAKLELGKAVVFDKYEEIVKIGVDQYEFGHTAVVGIKIALVQFLIGQNEEGHVKANVVTRISIMGIASCFSKKFVEALKKDAKLEDVKTEEVELEDVFDDEETETPEVSEEVAEEVATTEVLEKKEEPAPVVGSSE